MVHKGYNERSNKNAEEFIKGKVQSFKDYPNLVKVIQDKKEEMKQGIEQEIEEQIRKEKDKIIEEVKEYKKDNGLNTLEEAKNSFLNEEENKNNKNRQDLINSINWKQEEAEEEKGDEKDNL